MGKTSIKIYPNDYKRSKKTKRTPLYLDTMQSGIKVSKRLDWELTPSERQNWNDMLQRVEEMDIHIFLSWVIPPTEYIDRKIIRRLSRVFFS